MVLLSITEFSLCDVGAGPTLEVLAVVQHAEEEGQQSLNYCLLLSLSVNNRHARLCTAQVTIQLLLVTPSCRVC